MRMQQMPDIVSAVPNDRFVAEKMALSHVASGWKTGQAVVRALTLSEWQQYQEDMGMNPDAPYHDGSDGMTTRVVSLPRYDLSDANHPGTKMNREFFEHAKKIQDERKAEAEQTGTERE
jgi:hypothetical protein